MCVSGSLYCVSGLLFGDYDKKLWPNSKNLAKYMQHYAHTQGLNIAYNTPVVSVSKQGEEFVTKTQNGDLYYSRYLLLATGLGKPIEPDSIIEGGSLDHYRNASVDTEDYEGKRVLILGRGNAAFEFASNIMGSTQHVHMLGQQGRMKQAWETHYPGHVRVLHHQLLETYMLKSMDIMMEENFTTLKFIKHHNTSLWTVEGRDEVERQETEYEILEPSVHGYHK